MNEGLLMILAGAYLLSPVALAVVVAVQGRRRKNLEEEVRRLALQVDALGRRVAGQGASASTSISPAAAPALTAPSEPAPAPPPLAQPVLETTLPPAGEPAYPSPPSVAAPSPPPPSAASSPASVPAPPPAPRPTPRRQIDWESLVGVRLFSWIAGVALLVAGIAFARYSIEHGWLGPAARAAILAVAGVGLLVGAETERARRYGVTAQSLAAAGVAILFSDVYAAHTLWRLVPAAVAFPLLVLVAAVAVVYAIRRASLPMALLGLAGGFATPFLLSTGVDRPIGLFSYLLLLDAGMAWVAYKRRWPHLAALSLGLTALYQLGWVARFLGEGNLGVAVVVFLVFPAFGFLAFALASRREPGTIAEPIARWTAALGAVPPLLFLLHAAGAADLTSQWPLLVAFAVLLALGLLLVAAWQGPEWLHLLGAAGAVGGLLRLVHGGAPEGAWPVLLLPILALAAVLLGLPPLLARRGRPFRAEARYGVLAAPALLLVFPFVAGHLPSGAEPLPVLAGLLALAGAAGWSAAASSNGPLLLAAGLLAPWGALVLADESPGQPILFLAGAVLLGGVGVAALLGALRRRPAAGALRWLAAGAVALLVDGQAVAALASSGAAPLPVVLVAELALLAGLLAVSDRTGLHAISVVAAVTSCAAGLGLRGHAGERAFLVVALLLPQVGAAWLLVRRGVGSTLPAWAAALASALTLLVLHLELPRLGLGWLVGPAALAEGALLVPLLLALLRRPGGLEAERSRLAVVAGAILGLVTAAIPLQLENEWITVGWALLAAALAWLHGRLRHPGLLLWIAGLAAAVVIRLAVNPAVLHYHARSGVPVWNFWLYAYGVPGLALLGAARLLPRDADRLREGFPRLAPWLAAAGGLLLFLLLNVEIADAFSETTYVHLRLTGGLAYDLALTIGWAVFAVGLLVAGLVARGKPARIAAIALLAVTVLKCFLLDLGSLTGLYRVGSLVGLAVSLALVAVILQRFVLADRDQHREAP